VPAANTRRTATACAGAATPNTGATNPTSPIQPRTSATARCNRLALNASWS